MMHVTCDLCGKELRPGEDQRFVVKIEVFAAHDPYALTESDLDEDHMEEISHLLQEEDAELDAPSEDDLACKNLRYDLCPGCRKRFVKDPLSREAHLNFDFSEN